MEKKIDREFLFKILDIYYKTSQEEYDEIQKAFFDIEEVLEEWMNINNIEINLIL